MYGGRGTIGVAQPTVQQHQVAIVGFAGAFCARHSTAQRGRSVGRAPAGGGGGGGGGVAAVAWRRAWVGGGVAWRGVAREECVRGVGAQGGDVRLQR